MKLRFDRNKVAEIAAAVENGTDHVKPYTGGAWGVPEDKTPGILLVGDHGVYLIGNHAQPVPPAKSGLVAYAEGCDPAKDSGWWERKNAGFGPDDGVEFLPLEEAKRLLLGKARPFVEIGPDEVVWGVGR